MGLSAGGTQALRYLLSQFPADFPVPIAAIVHMPLGFTRPFAKNLNQLSALEVREAFHGMELKPGRVVLGRSGEHLFLRRKAQGVVCFLQSGPTARHAPSIDLLFESAAEAFGKATLSGVLTGIGEDDRVGAAWVKAQGGTVLAENESSCVVYGMPRSVIEAGLADAVYPLSEFPPTYQRHDADWLLRPRGEKERPLRIQILPSPGREKIFSCSHRP